MASTASANGRLGTLVTHVRLGAQRVYVTTSANGFLLDYLGSALPGRGPCSSLTMRM